MDGEPHRATTVSVGNDSLVLTGTHGLEPLDNVKLRLCWEGDSWSGSAYAKVLEVEPATGEGPGRVTLAFTSVETADRKRIGVLLADAM